MLEDRIIVVTGGFGRLGPALAQAIEASGGTAVLTSRDEKKVAAFNDESNRSQRRARARVLRFGHERDLAEFAEQAVSDHGAVHGLVNNAYAALGEEYVADSSFNSWEHAIRTNVSSAERLASALVDRHARSQISSIVNVASMYAQLAPDFSMYPDGRAPPAIEYGATKAALVYVTKYLAAKWGPLGVRVNAVSPGGIHHEQSEEFLDRYAKTVPMGRMVEKSEVADTVCFLLADGSSGITGQNVVVDGGRGIW